MSFDFYKEVHEIEVELTRNGYSDLGQLIKDSVRQGSTGTEIFMALRYNLKNIKNHNLNEKLLNRIDVLIKYIDKSLN